VICFIITVILNYVLIFIVLLTIIKNINFEYIFLFFQHYLARSAIVHIARPYERPLTLPTCSGGAPLMQGGAMAPPKF